MPVIHISRALQIEGWMELDELAWLAEEAGKHDLIVEVGSYLGRSTRALADNALGRVFAVDDWYGPRRAGDRKPDGNAFKDEDRVDLFERFKANLADHIETKKLIPMKMDYSEMGVRFAGGLVPKDQPDMVFIDGDHEYDSVYRDIDIWKNFIRPGGLLCGHDANYGHVVDAIAAHKLVIYHPDRTNIWAVKC